MTDRFSEQAARILGPVAAADSTWKTGVVRFATTGANQAVTLPARDTTQMASRKSPVNGRFLRVVALTSNVQFAFGLGAAPTLVASASGYASGALPGTQTPNAGAGMTILAGFPEQLIVPPDATHFSVFSEAAGAFEAYISDGPA